MIPNNETKRWNTVWGKDSWGKYYGVEQYEALSMRLGMILNKYLPKGNENKILELGCAKGKQLITYGKRCGYQLYGIDKSQDGAELARRNLSLAGLHGTILCEDLFKTSLEPSSFDIVYSMGLIEHFENPSDVIDIHIKLLKENGLLIMTTPNVKESLNLQVKKWLGEQENIYKAKNMVTCDADYLRKTMQNRGVKLLYCNYTGCIDLLMLGIDRMNKYVLYTAMAINQAIGYSTFFMPSSKYLSPHILIVARKGK